MKVLSDPNNSHIISWMPRGLSFAVIDPGKFVEEILPKHFKSAKFSSFTRKLHRWGFIRVDDISGEFYHELFRKNRFDLAEKMSCHYENKVDDEKEEEAKKPKPSLQEEHERNIRIPIQREQPAEETCGQANTTNKSSTTDGESAAAATATNGSAGEGSSSHMGSTNLADQSLDGSMSSKTKPDNNDDTNARGLRGVFRIVKEPHVMAVAAMKNARGIFFIIFVAT